MAAVVNIISMLAENQGDATLRARARYASAKAKSFDDLRDSFGAFTRMSVRVELFSYP